MKKSLLAFLTSASLIFLGLPLVGCGSDSSSGAEETGAGGAGMGAGGAGGETGGGGGSVAAMCTNTGLTVETTQIEKKDFGLRLTAQNSIEIPYDTVVVDLKTGRPNTPAFEAGTVSLEGTNYKDCGLCVMAFRGCSAIGCEKVFYASTGEVELTELGVNEDDEGRFAGILKNVVFEEVTIRGGESIPTEGGETWCMNDHPFDGDFTGMIPVPGSGGGGGGVNPGDCDSPTLACVGEVVNDFSMYNCGTQSQKSLTEHFSGGKAGLVLLTAGWCGACERRVPEVGAMLNNPQYESFRAAVVIGDTRDRMQPDQRYCERYASEKNVPLDSMFIDHNGQASFRSIFANIWPYLSEDGRFGLPFHAVLDARTMEYVYGDRGPASGTANQHIGQLMNR